MTNYTEVVKTNVSWQTPYIEVKLHFTQYTNLRNYTLNYNGEIDIALLLSEKEARQLRDDLKGLVERLENSLG